ncbi:mannonate dehydratase [Sphingomonas quercus]|uniref:Mannonate dehydratase n=1 Tax=Sphingomonas quercus TaxID=2842451 RepID=A0ABS6BHU8_9SPHN|nr:mannonate dehydratase [Sphingomonas quercus]MBU3077879.1 mannonate dehydratase [Sphingomonas quercus]
MPALAAAQPSRRVGRLGPGQVFADLKVRVNEGFNLGGDYHSVAGDAPTDRKSLEFFKRYGANLVTITASRNLAQVVGQPVPSERSVEELGPWDGDALKRMQDDCRKMDMVLECVRMDSAFIIMKTNDDRRRWLDRLKDNIRKCSEAGVTSISYHWCMIPQQRNKRAVVRGGATHNGFTLPANWRTLPPDYAGVVSLEEYWARIEIFLKDIIPVARQYKVRMSLHPFDPGGLPAGYLGVTNYDADFANGLKRYVAMVDDPHNALSYCAGVGGESFKNPNDQLEIMRYLLERNKVTQVHMRNIIGGQNDFQEVFLDMGDINYYNITRLLRDTGYAGTILPDHNPRHPDDPKSLQSYGFANGYLLGLKRGVNEEAKLILGQAA